MLTVLGESLLNGQLPKKGPGPPKLKAVLSSTCAHKRLTTIVFIHV